jgi:hypothetical protein
MQRSVDNLGSSVTELLNKKASLEQFVYRFRSTNQKYVRIKNVAFECVNRFFLHALREPDKKGLLSIVLSAVIETLRQNPERYNIIFGNNSENNNQGNNINTNTYEQQDAVLEVSAKLSKVLIDQLVNQTMSALELESEDTEERSTAESKAKVAAENENENTPSPSIEEGEANDKEDEAKPQQDADKSTEDTASSTTTEEQVEDTID